MWRWIILSTLSVQGLYISPFYVGALIDKLGFNASEAGLISGAEYGAVALAGIFVFLLLDRLNWRSIIVLCASSAAISNFLCLSNGDFTQVVSLRVIAGFSAGTLYSIAFALLARSARPERNFGWSMTLQSILASVYLLLLPRFIEQWGINAIYYLEMTTILFCIIVAIGLRQEASEANRINISSSIGIFSTLSGLVFFSIAQGALWAFVERIGDTANIDAEMIGFTLMVATILGVGGGLTSAIQGNKFGFSIPLITVFLGQTLSIFILWISPGSVFFMISVGLFNFLWVYAIAFQLGIVAVKDISGKSCALATTFQALGLAIGAAIAGALLDLNGNFDLVYLAIIGSGAVSLWLMIKQSPVAISETANAEGIQG